MTENRDRAVVLGGSIAGTLAARVLADSYREVVIVDRDELLGVREPRRGAPHAVHAHGLLARGHMIMEELFPGLTAELSAAGAPTYDIGDVRWYAGDKRLELSRTGMIGVAARRSVLEAHLRDRVARKPNVVFRERHEVLEPVASRDRSRVVGVRIARSAAPGEAAPEPETLTADLVVDATGQGSHTPQWLESLGYERPEEERIAIGVGYATRHYKLAHPVPGVIVTPSPAQHRGAFFAPVGPGTYALSLVGVLGDHPPVDPEFFDEFVRSLPVGGIAEALRDAEPLDDPVHFGFPASVRRRYERLARFPQGLLPIGDAIAALNPVYGQGMSVAALEAIALRRHLGVEEERASLLFLRDAAEAVDGPWAMSAGSDLGYPEVPGRRTGQVRLLNAYVGRLQRAATEDARITEAFLRVAGLIDPPQALLAPRTVFRVLRGALPRLPWAPSSAVFTTPPLALTVQQPQTAAPRPAGVPAAKVPAAGVPAPKVPAADVPAAQVPAAGAAPVRASAEVAAARAPRVGGSAPAGEAAQAPAEVEPAPGSAPGPAPVAAPEAVEPKPAPAPEAAKAAPGTAAATPQPGAEAAAPGPGSDPDPAAAASEPGPAAGAKSVEPAAKHAPKPVPKPAPKSAAAPKPAPRPSQKPAAAGKPAQASGPAPAPAPAPGVQSVQVPRNDG